MTKPRRFSSKCGKKHTKPTGKNCVRTPTDGYLTPHGAAVVTDERESVPGHIIGGVNGSQSPSSCADADEQGAGDDYRSNLSGGNAGLGQEDLRDEMRHLHREMATVDRRMVWMPCCLRQLVFVVNHVVRLGRQMRAAPAVGRAIAWSARVASDHEGNVGFAGVNPRS